MELEVVHGQITHFNADALVIYLMVGGPGTHPANATNAVDVLLGGALRRAVTAGSLTGRRGVVWTARLERPAVIVVGLGTAEAFGEEVAVEAVRLGCRRAAALGAQHVATVTLGTGRGGLSMDVSAYAVAEGALQAGETVSKVSLLVYNSQDLAATRAGLSRALSPR